MRPNTTEYIHLVTIIPNDWYEKHWFSSPGWYFPDKCEQLIGPFNTDAIARGAQAAYALTL